MERANQVGVMLSVLVGIVWVLVGMADWPVWLGVVVSMLVGGYWAFGRDFLKQDS